MYMRLAKSTFDIYEVNKLIRAAWRTSTPEPVGVLGLPLPEVKDE